MRTLLFVLAFGATATNAQTPTSAPLVEQLAQAAAQRSDAMHQVFGVLLDMSEQGSLGFVHDRWLRELERRGDGTAVEIGVLEAQLIAEHAEARDAYIAQYFEWDTDNSGVIDRDEAAAILAADQRHQYDLEQLDINRDEQITYDEILRVTQRRQGPFDLDDIAVMLIFDLDGDGFLTEPEINTVVDALAGVLPTE